jgi:AcrR family transcriptional regulator
VTEQTARRRRGKALEEALLDAAWEELDSVGFADFTIEGVAARAKTSRAVLYRRWPGKNELVAAAFQHYAERNPVDIPDTGSLRDDLLALLGVAAERRAALAALVSTRMSGRGDEVITPAEVRDRFIQMLISRRRSIGRPHWIDLVYQRAKARGELDPALLPEAVRSLPFDLLRHDMIMTLKPVPRQRIEEIVDVIFLPLVAVYAGRGV